MFGQSIDDNESYCTPGWNGDWEVYRWGAEAPQPDCHSPGDITASRVFGSAHPNGFSCVFADGSVRFVRYSVPAMTWRKVCVRDDNQSLNPDDM
jgi:prepilin-type processing-associated H-X9-DG protein